MKKFLCFIFIFIFIVTAAGCAAGQGDLTGTGTETEEALDGVTPVVGSGSVSYNGSEIYAEKKIEINGVKSNASFFVNAPAGGTINSARDFAADIGGDLINCAATSTPGVSFSNARVEFFVGGVNDGDDIAVYQLQGRDWVKLNVSGIKKDHVIVNLTQHGVLAFIRLASLAVGSSSLNFPIIYNGCQLSVEGAAEIDG